MRQRHVPADVVQSANDDCALENGSRSEKGIPQTPALNVNSTSTPVAQFPNPVDFFKNVRPDGYPEQGAAQVKTQPWKAVWRGPQVSKDGKLLIACPKGCDWGSGSGLGGY